MIDSTDLNLNEPSFGDDSIRSHPAWRYLVWELIISVFSKISGLHVRIIFHVVLPFLLAILAVSANLRLARFLFEGFDPWWATLAILVCYCIFLSTNYSAGCFLLTRLWQGKSVFLHVLYPTMVLALLSYLRDGKVSDLLLVNSSLLACLAVSQSALFLSLTSYVLLIVSHMFSRVEFPGWKNALYLGAAMVMPLLVLTDVTGDVATYFRVQEVRTVIESFSWYDNIEGYIGSDYALLALALMVVPIYLIDGNSKIRIFLVSYPLTLIVTVLNPWSAQVIGKDLQVAGNYFRFFWLYPTAFMAAWAVTRIGRLLNAMFSINSRAGAGYVAAIGMMVGLAIGLSGFNVECCCIDRKNRVIDNVFKVHADALTVLESIDRHSRETDVCVLAPDVISWIIPTYSRHVKVVVSKRAYLDYFFGFPEKRADHALRLRLFKSVWKATEDEAQLLSDLNAMGVNIVVLYLPRGDVRDVFQRLGFRQELASGNYVMLTRFRPL
jgi:hypothetical protein